MSNFFIGFCVAAVISAAIFIAFGPISEPKPKPKPKRSHHKRKCGSAE